MPAKFQINNPFAAFFFFDVKKLQGSPELKSYSTRTSLVVQIWFKFCTRNTGFKLFQSAFPSLNTPAGPQSPFTFVGAQTLYWQLQNAPRSPIYSGVQKQTLKQFSCTTQFLNGLDG